MQPERRSRVEVERKSLGEGCVWMAARPKTTHPNRFQLPHDQLLLAGAAAALPGVTCPR